MDRLEQMQIFCRVAERGSFSAVARDLYTSQPSISRSIQALEAHLGLRLLQRSTRRLNLTEAGQQYYHRCRKWLDDLDAFEAELRGEQQKVRGRLTATMPTSMGESIFNQLFLRFQTQHPELVLDLLLADSFVDLIAEGIDLALRIGRLNDLSLEHHKLGRIQRRVVGVPGWLESLPEVCTPEELATLPFVTFSRLEGGQALTFQTPQGPHTIQVQPRFLTNHVQVLRQALLAGVGIGSAPDWLISEDLAQGRLVPMPVAPDFTLSDREIYVLYPSRDHLPAKVKQCLDFLRWELPRVPGVLPP